MHVCHALADAYTEGARAGGHTVDSIAVAALECPLLRSKAGWEHGEAPPAIRKAQERMRQADHLVLLYPLWLGTLPALLKAFLEQALRPGFALGFDDNGRWHKQLTGRSARVVVTMGMPALAYRWFFRAHSLQSLDRNILRFVGIRPVRETLIGSVENMGPARREKILANVRALGQAAR